MASSSGSLPSCPPSLKHIQQILKVAAEHEKRDPVITYWCRLHALQEGIKISSKAKDSHQFLLQLMSWLENEKKSRSDEDAITSDLVAHAHIEGYGLKLFLWADTEDRASRFNKNVVKTFYTAGILFDVLNSCGEVSDEIQNQRKYAKWKAIQIGTCLKNGETPTPGPMGGDDAIGHDETEEINDDGSTRAPSYPPVSSFPDDISSFNSIGGQVPTSRPGFNSANTQLPYPTNNLMPPGSGLHAPPSTPSERPSSPNEPSSSSSSSSVSHHHHSTVIATSSNLLPRQQGNLNPEDSLLAQKYCKWARSALQYDDVPTAVVNLQKALKLLIENQNA